MATPIDRSELESRIHDLARQLGEAAISIGGSLGTTHRRCGRAGCRCATDDLYKHPSRLLNSKVTGKTKSIYIPVAIAGEVEQWVQRRQKMKELLKQIDSLAEQIIRAHVPVQKDARADRPRRKSTTRTSSRSS